MSYDQNLAPWCGGLSINYIGEFFGISSIVHKGTLSDDRLYVYLHGAGGFGPGHERQYEYPDFPSLLRDDELVLEHTFVIACCHTDTHWRPSALSAYFENLKTHLDKTNIDLIGYSRGGKGVYEYLKLYADIRTATVINSQCPERLAELKKVPLHIIHAIEDQVTPISNIERVVDDYEGKLVSFSKWEGDHFSIESIARAKLWADWIESVTNDQFIGQS